MSEIWKLVIGQEGCYSVSDNGRVLSEERRCFQGRNGSGSRRVPEKILAQNSNKKGYLKVRMAGKNVLVHTLVLESFICLCPIGMQARHLDGNPSNNHVRNLVWGTSLENSKDREAHGRTVRGSSVRQSKLTEDDVYEIRLSSLSDAKLASKFGVTISTVRLARIGKTWRHVPF